MTMRSFTPFDFAEAYRQRGFAGTLALPARTKSPPPDGFTGYDGRWPSDDDLASWRGERLTNIALRLPPTVIGIDVDAYGSKRGGETLADLEAQYGALPATWISTSRDDRVSGIRFFRVPVIETWPTGAGRDIEIIRFAHRYALVAPSIHPEGTVYRWVKPDGADAADGEIPYPADFAELPASWVNALTGASTNGNGSGPHTRPGSRAKKNEQREDARTWIARLPDGEPCKYSGRLEADALAAARREDGNAYDHTRDAVLALLRAGEQGHRGIPDILTRVGREYVNTVAADRGGRNTAIGEFERFTLDGVARVLVTPTTDRESQCKCRPLQTETVSVSANDVTPPQLPTLPETFWRARPVLQHIRQAAHARNRGGDPVFHCVLARVAAFRPAAAEIETGIGAPASLNYFAALVDPSGSGKSSPEKIARRLLPASADDTVADGLPVGSGEGLAEVFMGWTTRANEDGKKERIRAQTRFNAFVYIDEGQALTRLLERNGSTIGETLRRAFGGEKLGQTNASQDRSRVVADYSLGLVIGLQPEAAGALLEDAGHGTPQRFCWTATSDPTIPDNAPEWPGPLWLDLAGSFRPYTLDDTVAAEIREDDLARARGTQRRKSLDAHEPLCRIKLAGLLATLDNRTHVTREDWELATAVWQTSCAVRDTIVEYSQRLAAAVKREQTRAFASRAAAADAAVTARHAAVERVARTIWRAVHAAGTLSRRDAGVAVAGRDRKRGLLEPAIAYAIRQGWLTETEAGYAGRQAP